MDSADKQRPQPQTNRRVLYPQSEHWWRYRVDPTFPCTDADDGKAFLELTFANAQRLPAQSSKSEYLDQGNSGNHEHPLYRVAHNPERSPHSNHGFLELSFVLPLIHESGERLHTEYNHEPLKSNSDSSFRCGCLIAYRLDDARIRLHHSAIALFPYRNQPHPLASTS